MLPFKFHLNVVSKEIGIICSGVAMAKSYLFKQELRFDGGLQLLEE